MARENHDEAFGVVRRAVLRAERERRARDVSAARLPHRADAARREGRRLQSDEQSISAGAAALHAGGIQCETRCAVDSLRIDRRTTMKRSATTLMFLFAVVAALANYPVDYSVYFDPQPQVSGGAQVATTPIRTTANGKMYERVYGIMYDVGETHGTHSYKYTLRAFGPGGLACETSTFVQPFGPKNSSRRIAYF